MPSQADWHAKLADTLNDRIERRDVWLALRVEADPSFALDSFDFDEFAEWAGEVGGGPVGVEPRAVVRAGPSRREARDEAHQPLSAGHGDSPARIGSGGELARAARSRRVVGADAVQARRERRERPRSLRGVC